MHPSLAYGSWRVYGGGYRLKVPALGLDKVSLDVLTASGHTFSVGLPH